MAGTNEILEFASEATTILTQDQYENNPQLENGLSGFTDNRIMNKILKQATLMAASLAQFMADNQEDDIVDTLDVPAMTALLTTAVLNSITESSAFASTQTTSGSTNLGNGMILKWGISTLIAGETNIAFPVQFPNNCFNVVGNDHSSNAYNVGTYTFTALGFKAIAKNNAGTDVITDIVWHAIGN
jgi:hypothetical protein